MSTMDIAAATNANRKPLRRTRRQASPTTVAVKEDNCAQQKEASISVGLSPQKNMPDGEAVVEIYCTLNDGDEPSSPSQEKRTEKRRAARRRGGRPSRPDASGRIGNKECHLLAFAEMLEEQVIEASVKQNM